MIWFLCKGIANESFLTSVYLFKTYLHGDFPQQILYIYIYTHYSETSNVHKQTGNNLNISLLNT